MVRDARGDGRFGSDTEVVNKRERHATAATTKRTSTSNLEAQTKQLNSKPTTVARASRTQSVWVRYVYRYTIYNVFQGFSPHQPGTSPRVCFAHNLKTPSTSSHVSPWVRQPVARTLYYTNAIRRKMGCFLSSTLATKWCDYIPHKRTNQTGRTKRDESNGTNQTGRTKR